MFGNTRDFKSMARTTFITFLDIEFTNFIDKVKGLLTTIKSHSYGRKFAQIIHDMWTSCATQNCLGAGMSFMDENFNWYFIPCMMVVNNTSHGAAFNANLLKNLFFDRFDMDISSCAKFMGSDTTNAATAVSNQFEDVEQVDCEMRILNLILLYGIGFKEHYQTKNKIRRVVLSVGGEFKAGAHIVSCLRDICTYFRTGQRLQALKNVQDMYVAPEGTPSFDGVTRVSSVHRLLKGTILHHWSLKKYYDVIKPKTINKKEKDKFMVAWDSLEIEHWKLVLEMECIMKDIARYSMGSVQRTGCLSSETLIWRRITLKITNQEQFHPLPLKQWEKNHDYCNHGYT